MKEDLKSNEVKYLTTDNGNVVENDYKTSMSVKLLK